LQSLDVRFFLGLIEGVVRLDNGFTADDALTAITMAINESILSLYRRRKTKQKTITTYKVLIN